MKQPDEMKKAETPEGLSEETLSAVSGGQGENGDGPDSFFGTFKSMLDASSVDEATKKEIEAATAKTFDLLAGVQKQKHGS
ncbi:MAG: hypothetical protein IK082_06625 [Oscillospiraceae bacterium]|nr:hypothetical protein [Oscillospiraceae bacterium]